MARKKQPKLGKGDGYIVSFAGTMTTMLAFFIVLSSLADEQTGVNFHAGTGSFIRALNTFGLPGLFPGETSARATQSEAPGPVYQMEGTDARDSQDKHSRIVDAESEQWQHFMERLEESFDLDKLPRTTGMTTFDLIDPLGKSAPYLSERHFEVLGQVANLLRRGPYRVSLIVWAATPSRTAWRRAAEQAKGAADELAAAARLDRKARSRLIPLAQTWRFPKGLRDVYPEEQLRNVRFKRRPSFSVVVTKVEAN